MKKLWVILLSVSLTAAMQAVPRVRCFILCGQSNMAGMGKVAQAAAVYRDQADVWFDYANTIDAPTNTDWLVLGGAAPPGPTGQGPELSFGRVMADAFPLPEERVAIVKVSKAGTGISYWNTPGQSGYDTLMARIDNARNWLNARQTAGDISGWEFAGFVYMQGENEANSTVSVAGKYYESLSNLVSEVRAYTGATNLPVVVGRIDIILDPIYEGPVKQPQLDLVRAAQVAYGQTTNNAAWVNTDDLNVLDWYHFDSLAQIRLGRRMAQAWLNLTQPRPRVELSAEPPFPVTGTPVARFRVNFSSPVTGFATNDVVFGGSALPAWATIHQAAPGDGSSYLVTIGGMTRDGTVTLAVPGRAAQGAGGDSFPATSETNTVLFTAAPAAGGLIAHEDFGPVERALDTAATGKGLQLTGWDTSGLTNGYRIRTNSPLTYGALRSSPPYATGGDTFKTCVRELNIMDEFIPYEEQRFDDHVSKHGLELWVSFLARRDASTAYTFALSRSSGVTANNQTVTIVATNGNWALGLLGTILDTGISATVGSNFLHVLQLQFDATNGGTARLFINPASLGGAAPNPATAVATLTTTSTNFMFRRIYWYPDSQPGKGSLDEIRIGTTYASVTPTTPSPAPYTAWRNANFTTNQITAGLGTATAAPAGDGIANLMKYALGLNPLTNGYRGRCQAATTNQNSQNYLTLTFTRPEPAPADALYTVETANELAPPDWTGSDIVELDSAAAAGTRTVVVRDLFSTAAKPKRFMRLKISNIP